MHKSGVVLLLVGGVILLVGAVGLGIGFLGAKDVAELSPAAKAVFTGSAKDGPKTATFKDAGSHQVWYLQAQGKPKVTIVDSKGTDVFEPLSPNTTVTLNEFGQLGSFTPASATETYTITVEGTSPVHVTHWSEEEVQKLVTTGVGIFGGCCASGLGGFLVVLGLILGFTLKKKAGEGA
mgnify:CR=1 FL=1